MKATYILPLVPIFMVLAQDPAAAQVIADPAGFSDEVTVNEVLLDVLVTDRDGNVIVGLDKDDFLVHEEGAIVPIAGSTFYSNRQLVDSVRTRAQDLPPAEVSEDRYFIFFLHDQRLAVPQLTTKYLELARRAENWIRTELLPNDWVAVVRYDFKLKVYADFSRDNEKLVQAVYDAARGKNPPDAWPSRADDVPTDAPSLLANLASGKELRRQTRRIYSGLSALADASGSVTGRKNLLFFSAGFGEESGLGTVLPDLRFYADTKEALNDNNVAVYSISVLTGADFGGSRQFQAQSLQNAMTVLANDTGGSYYFNHIAFGAPLERVLAENSGYYLLSYSSKTPASESGYRKVSVTAKNPDFKIRAREGYRFGA